MSDRKIAWNRDRRHDRSLILRPFLGRVGAEHHLDVDEISLDSPTGQDLATRGGGMFAPGVLLDGTLFSYGRLSERRLRRHLSRLPPTPPAPGSPHW